MTITLCVKVHVPCKATSNLGYNPGASSPLGLSETTLTDTSCKEPPRPPANRKILDSTCRSRSLPTYAPPSPISHPSPLTHISSEKKEESTFFSFPQCIHRCIVDGRRRRRGWTTKGGGGNSPSAINVSRVIPMLPSPPSIPHRTRVN